MFSHIKIPKKYFTLVAIIVFINLSFSQVEVIDNSDRPINVPIDKDPPGLDRDGSYYNSAKYFDYWTRNNQRTIDYFGYSRARVLSNTKYEIERGNNTLNNLNSKIVNKQNKLADLNSRNESLIRTMKRMEERMKSPKRSKNFPLKTKKIYIDKVNHENMEYACGMDAITKNVAVATLIRIKAGREYGTLLASILTLSSITHCQILKNRYDE